MPRFFFFAGEREEKWSVKEDVAGGRVITVTMQLQPYDLWDIMDISVKGK